MSKYVIKNCPAYKNNFCSIRDFYIQGCANCTDCVMKKIYDECKEETEIDIDLRGDLAERVMSEFDIQEVE